MKIAIEITPFKKEGRFLQHRVRGTGFYIENLKNALLKYCFHHNFIFFTKGEKLPIDLDIIHYPYFEPFFLTLPFRKSCKTVVTVHDLTPLVFPQHFPAGLKGAIKWRIQEMLLKRADVIITDSECSKKDIVKYTNINSKKIHVVYLAPAEAFRKLNKEKIQENLVKKYQLPAKFALYVGDATWNKNLPRLIQAIKKTHAPLVMVGKALVEKNIDQTNPWNQDLIQIRNLIHGEKKIITLGFIPTEDLVSLYNLATIFVMPSIYEGFGLPILEAMSCGCPVVTSKEGSIPEIAKEAVFYIDAFDITNIADGIVKVFENKVIQENLIEKGFQQVKKFSWKKTAENTIKTYEEKN